MKQYIKNRHSQNICVVVENYETKGKLAFVEHGLGGTKDQGHIRAMIEAFIESGYVVVSFDTTNTFGESDGKYEDATVTNSYEDLADVIKWASKQAWYIKPFVLCGHSLGGISIATYAEKYPDKIAGLAPIATVVSGELSFETAKHYEGEENLDHWRATGIRRTFSHDGSVEKILKWSHMEDRLKYDLLPKSKLLTMPVLLVVGTEDDRTPPDSQKMLYDAIPEPKLIKYIDGAEHSFHKQHERKELKQIIKNWLNSF